MDFPDRNKIEPYLRRKGMVGPLDDKVIDEIQWWAFATAATQALEEQGGFAGLTGVEAAQAYLDKITSETPDSARHVPGDDPVRVISLRAIELMNERFAS